MNVKCEACGKKAQVADHTGEDDWLYVTEERETMVDYTDPMGNVSQVPVKYPHRLQRYFIWLCDEPEHGPDGHRNTVVEDVPDEEAK